jgi:hypothetical protein
MVINPLAITKRCPIHLKPLVLDEANQVWRCPVSGCYYTVPVTPTVAQEEKPVE